MVRGRDNKSLTDYKQGGGCSVKECDTAAAVAVVPDDTSIRRLEGDINCRVSDTFLNTPRRSDAGGPHASQSVRLYAHRDDRRVDHRRCRYELEYSAPSRRDVVRWAAFGAPADGGLSRPSACARGSAREGKIGRASCRERV